MCSKEEKNNNKNGRKDEKQALLNNKDFKFIHAMHLECLISEHIMLAQLCLNVLGDRLKFFFSLIQWDQCEIRHRKHKEHLTSERKKTTTTNSNSSEKAVR